MKMSRRKLLLAIIGVAMVSITGIVAWTSTWTSCTIRMHAGTAAVAGIAQFEDCLLTTPLNYYDWFGIAQGETYQMEYYLRNRGTVGVYLSYLPGTLSFYDDQARMRIQVRVLEYGNIACQMFPEPGTPGLPLKDPYAPGNGYFLGPGKIVKLRVELIVDSVVSDGVYDWEFTVYGSTP